MQYISIIEQASKEAIRVFAEKRNVSKYFTEDYVHPQEDYLIASEKLSTFVVSDGVTLNFKKLIEDKKSYPNPSPAGEVAKIFCEAVQKSVQEKYTDIKSEDIREVFREANKVVGDYNNKIGKSDVCGNITGFYSATGSFVIIRNNTAYWASICDAFFAHFDRNMNIKFKSTGLCSPYAVVNGEDKMADYIEMGVVDIQDGDKLFVFTDGFEHYVKNFEFTELFKDWSNDLENRIKTFSERMNMIDPENYGHERSLIVINFEASA